LSFPEVWEYLQSRRGRLEAKFDTDGDLALGEQERAEADAYLRADLWALAGDQWSQPVKPAQVLGLLNALILAGLLAGFYRLRRRDGQAFALMLILYPITRFVLEGIRGDNRASLLTGALTHNQLSSLAILAFGVIMWAALRKFPASACPPAAGRHRGRRSGKGGQR